MDITPFLVYYEYRNARNSVQIRPCCREDNVVDYAVWYEGKLIFTITQHADTTKWVVALKNADDDIDDELVQVIGAEIEKTMAQKT